MQGGCFCGKIRYEITDGEYRVVNCHCTMCRKTSAASFVSWILVPRKAFRYLTGEPKQLQSSAKASRDFCADCGTPLSFSTDEHADKIDITSCSLDDPELAIPSVDVHEESRLAWLNLKTQSQ